LLLQSGGELFGKPSLEINYLLRQDTHYEGIISRVRLTDIQDRPQLNSTFRLGRLAELYNSPSEAGDLEKPKWVLLLDEVRILLKRPPKPY